MHRPLRSRVVAGSAFAVLLVVLGAAASALAVSLDWVEVASPGNACESQAQGCFGAVADAYWVARTEVTNAQYAEFLNAVAASDPSGLYNPAMAWAGSGFGGINRSGSDGSYVYTAAAGREDMPVNFVSFYDALRFANWLHNGQPAGAQGALTTEDGSYTLTPQGIDDNAIGRNAGATTVLASEDEWYKAAYYDGAGYHAYPLGASTPTECADATVVMNRANCENAVGEGIGGLTPVGSYESSDGPHGHLDQGGNVWEWNESILADDFRGLRGGAFNHDADFLAASHQSLNDPTAETNNIGFRVARLPEPRGVLLFAAGALGVWVGGLVRARRRGRRAAFAALLALTLPVAGSAADDLLGSARGGTSMWDYCQGKPDAAPVPADPRTLVNPATNTDKAVHYNVRWRNCHVDPEAVDEVGPPETCGDMRARFERGGVLLDPGSEGPGGLFSGNTAGDGNGFTAAQFNQLWLTWGGFLARPENFDTLVAERYGSPFSDDPNPYPLPGENPNETNGGSGKLPIMFTQMRDAEGAWTSEITVTCHACHSGQVGVPGGPGPGVLWGGGSSLADLNLLLRDFLALGWQASATVVANLNRTRGRNNASLVNVAFGAAGLDASTLPGLLTSGSTADMDTVSWWNMGHRPAKFVDGIFAMDTPRVDGVFYAPLLGATEPGKAWMRQHGPDLNVWVESQTSPPWPYEIDTALAEEGAVLFHKKDLWKNGNEDIPRPEGNGSCASCHGAYAPRYVNDPAYLDSPALEGIAGYTVPLETIGTDPKRVEANNESIQEAGRSSFFGYPPTRDTPQDCGPQNHPELNDGRVPGYMAPPLYGIWATAPYFHNGSVPNLWEVLEPADRVEIWRRWSKPDVALAPPNVLADPVMGFDPDLDRAFDTAKVGWRYDEIPCEVGSVFEPTVTPYLSCDPDPDDGLDPLAEQILDLFYTNVFLGWNLGFVPPVLPSQAEERKIFNTRMFAQGNEGHEFTKVLTDAERLALIEYLKTL